MIILTTITSFFVEKISLFPSLSLHWLLCFYDNVLIISLGSKKKTLIGWN